MTRKHKLFKVITIVMVVITLVLALYIMAHRLGVVSSYDFGAGAYYYADIPAEQYGKIAPQGDYQTSVPRWMYYVLFVAWGWLMWRVWIWVDRK